MSHLFLLLCCLLISSPARAELQFRIHSDADVQTLDWTLAHTHMDRLIITNIMEGLLSYDEGLALRPGLATSWTVSPDAKVYTFKLRSGVLWSDGHPFQAQDVVFAWRRLLDATTASSYRYLLYDIVGAREFGETRDFSKVGIRAPDKLTLEVTLSNPSHRFLHLLTFWPTFPQREDLVRKFGNGWKTPEHIAVLGPYLPVSHVLKDRLLLKRNDRYHGARPMADSVLVRVLSSELQAVTAFANGELDFINVKSRLDVGEHGKKLAFQRQNYLRTCFLNFNTSAYPFNLPKVRQAFAAAIDVSRIEEALHRTVTPTRSLVPPKLLPEGATATGAFDPVRARKLLAEVGLGDKNFPHTEIMAYAADENALFGEFLVEQLKKNLGIKITERTEEYDRFRTNVETKATPLYERCWSGDYADAESFLSIFLSYAGSNRTFWKSAEYDEAVAAGNTATVTTERTRHYLRALKILHGEGVPLVPVYFDTFKYALGPRIRRITPNELNHIDFKSVVFAPAAK